MRLRIGNRSILFWLRILAIVAFAPAWAGIALLIMDTFERERSILVNGTIETARVLRHRIEGDLAAAQSALRVLAASPFLGSGDLAAFHSHAREVLAGQVGNSIVLVDLQGQQLVNTLRRYGDPLPSSAVPDLIHAVLETGKPAMADFYSGATSEEAQIAVGVPVFRQDRTKFVLTMGIRPAHINELLRGERLPADWVISVYDSKGTVIARTQATDQFVGKKGAPLLLQSVAEKPEGVVETTTLEGIPVFAAFSRSKVSGLTVVIGIPSKPLIAGLRARLLLGVTVAVVVLLITLFIARCISLRITRSITALAAPALALASGGSVTVPPFEVKEVDEVGDALTKAAALLEERAKAREDALRSEHQMAIEKEAAEQRNQAKSQFLTMMSHELRTPLNGILGFAQMLDAKLYGPLTTKQTEFAKAILTSGNHLLELINDILELSKIEAGRLTVSLEPVELGPLMKSVVANLEPAAERAGLVLGGQDFGRHLPAIRADRVRMAQCLFNLGSNAIKYNRPGGSVTFACTRENDIVRIAVIDTGIGIPEERQKEIFEPFNRLGAEQKGIDGTGIGLALTRRLVELMGGRLGFVSVAGEGSRFWVDIPVYTGSAAEATPAHAFDQMPRISNASILYIEDNPLTMSLMRDLLATFEHVSLLEATNGAMGLAIAEEHKPDLIIIDIDLPDTDGLALLKRLRAIPVVASTPILALSGNATAGDVRRGVAAGFFAYLTKPFEIRKFLATVRTALLASQSRAS